MSKKEENAKIYLSEPVPFDGTNESKFVTTVTLCKYVNELFKAAFKDYIGCTITPNLQNNGIAGELISLDLYFAPNGDNGKGAELVAFVPVGRENADKDNEDKPEIKNNYTSMAMQHNARITTTSSMVVSSDAIDTLYDLLHYNLKKTTKKNSKSFASKGIAVETSAATQFGNTRSYVYNIIRGVNLDEIMKIIFGDEGNNFEFQVVPVKPVLQVSGPYQNNGAMDSKWLFNIVKANKNDISDIMNELGYYSKVSDFGIVTDTF